MISAWVNSIDWAATGAMLSGLATAAVAVLTVLVVYENRQLRRAGNSPNVVAHFEFHPDGAGGLNLALSNVGTGPAFDVLFVFEYEADDFENYSIIVDYATQRLTMTMISQGEKVSFLFAIGFQLFQPKDTSVSKQLKPFHVKVSWRTSGSSKRISETYQLDVSAYAGLPGMMNKPHLMKVADELAGIKKELAKLTLHSRSLSTNSVSTFVDTTSPEQGVRNIVKGSPSTVSEGPN